jgi:O-antigen biosynthesis protein WbqP
VGKGNRHFKMFKFRSMKLGTPIVGTHLLEDPKKALTPIGRYLRQWSIDELPQIWNILQGDMSFVGPRPALYNQADLIALRTEKSIDSMVPGLTGWAQINGRDELSIYDKVSYDQEYMLRQSFNFDLKILWLTYLKVIHKESISH